MHIAFFAPSLPALPANGGDGISIISASILQRAMERGHTVELFVFGDAQNPPVLPGMTVHVLPAPRTSLVRYLGWPFRRQPWHLVRWFSQAMQQAVEHAAHDPAVDLLVLHSPFFAGYLQRVGTKPTVLHAIDALSGWFTQVAQQTRSPLRRWHLRQEARRATRVEKALYPHATAVVVVAHADRDMLRLHAPATNVQDIPNGVDVALYRPSHAPVITNRIVFTGSLDYPPNVQAVAWFAKNVWPKVTRKIPGATWEIVGRNPVASIRALAQRPGTLLYQNVPSTIPHLQRASVVIVPTFVASGVKNTVLEAMACGKPLVATPAGVNGLPVHAGNEALVALTAEAFTNALLRVLRDGGLRAHLGAAARAFAEDHTWPHTADKYLALYDQLVHAT